MTRYICGIDEAGRGPLAGPIVAAGVVIPEGFDLQARDSKKLSEKKRDVWEENFHAQFEAWGVKYAIVEISVAEINARGIGWANKEVFRRLIRDLEADEYLVDGNLKLKTLDPADLAELGDKLERVKTEVKGDERIPVIAAASIVAKTHRDHLMRRLHDQYPQYHWDKNKGYGSAQHISAIRTFGRTPHHRRQFTDTVENKNYTRKGQPYGAQLLLLGSGSLLLTLLLGQILPVLW